VRLHAPQVRCGRERISKGAPLGLLADISRTKILLLSLVICLMGISLTVCSAGGGFCKKGRCTYVDSGGAQLEGICGTRKDDTQHCYCFLGSDKSIGQVQTSCGVPR
jgi:hypothetical protein